MKWKRKAIACLQNYTPILIIDKLSNSDCKNSMACSEISPHIQDGVLGDGNCGFRAIAKQQTGTESNHPAIRAAIVQYMYDFNVNRTTHPIITSATCPNIDSYIHITKMNRLHTRMSDIELRYLATLLQIDIMLFTTFGLERKWIPHPPIAQLQGSMPRSENNYLYLYMNTAVNHFDNVLFIQMP